MKKLLTLSLLLLVASNAWAECDKSDPTIVWVKCLQKERGSATSGVLTRAEAEKQLEKIGSHYDTRGTQKAFAVGIGKNNTLAYAYCMSRGTMQAAKDCAKQACLRISSHCEFAAVNNERQNTVAIIGQKLGWNTGQQYNQPLLSNNQSTQNKINKSAKKRTVSESNGSAKDLDGLITKGNLQQQATYIDKLERTLQQNKATAFGTRNDQLVWAICSNKTSTSIAQQCALKKCRLPNCQIVHVNNETYTEIANKITATLSWNPNRSNQSNNDTIFSRFIKMKADESERRQREHQARQSEYSQVITIDFGFCPMRAGVRLVKSEDARYGKTICYYR